MFDIPGKKTYDELAQIGFNRCNTMRGETAVEADPYSYPDIPTARPGSPISCVSLR